VSLPLAFTMVVAYYTTELDAVKNIFDKPEDFINGAPFLFLLAALIVLAFGPGALSLDRVIEKFFIGKGSEKKKPAEKKG
jgi:putative oxidoreductase